MAYSTPVARFLCISSILSNIVNVFQEGSVFYHCYSIYRGYSSVRVFSGCSKDCISDLRNFPINTLDEEASRLSSTRYP